MLRVTVDGGGCSGFMYKFNLDTSTKNDDKYAPILILCLPVVVFYLLAVVPNCAVVFQQNNTM